ncbi:uncharacterized protein PG998_005046 [Apiospora kogelbergensis]|uniref:uncharacterized protein n=1 Tax=Apiospora kogelbergensis TaxID=1337665 RepID=UPI00312D1281
MTSRCQKGTTESLSISRRPGPPKGADGGFAYNHIREDHEHPFCSNETVPRVSNKRNLGDFIYHDEMGKLSVNAEQWLSAFARGDDGYLAVVLSQASGQMDRVFRAPLMLKTPKVVDSDWGWHPETPGTAIELMWYLSNRASFEFQQAKKREFYLKEINHQTLESCCDNLRKAVKECKAWCLFKKDEGWLFDRPYSELWNNQWCLNKSKTALATPPATPTIAGTPVAANTPVDVITTSVPATTQARKPLPTGPSRQIKLGQKRSRSKSPSSAPSKRLPEMGTWSQPVKATENHKDTAPSQPGGGVSDAIVPSKANAKVTGLSSKTAREQAKGAKLDDDALGQDAIHSCAACAKSESKRSAEWPKTDSSSPSTVSSATTASVETLEAMKLRQASRRRKDEGPGQKGGPSIALVDVARE